MKDPPVEAGIANLPSIMSKTKKVDDMNNLQ